MNNASAVGLFLLSCLLTGAQCRSNGAPNAACTNVSPDPSAHGADAQSGLSPYTLSGLPTNGNYTPGMTYALTLTGMNSETFRGFLAVAMNGASQRVGSFSASPDGKTTCDDLRGITHTSASDKTSVSFTWTAPSAGTGQVQVRFAVVRVQATYWANQLAATLQEAQPEPSTSSDMASPSPSTASPSPTVTPGGGGGNSVPSNVAGSFATILLAAVAFVMVAAFI